MQMKDPSNRRNADHYRALSAAEVASVGGSALSIPLSLLYPIYVAVSRPTKN